MNSIGVCVGGGGGGRVRVGVCVCASENGVCASSTLHGNHAKGRELTTNYSCLVFITGHGFPPLGNYLRQL